jgi:hypothetical protein
MMTDAGTVALKREMNAVGGAIAMVAAGLAPRVTVGGLQFGEELLATADRLANEAGVRVVPLYRAGEHGAGILVESERHD